MRTLTLQFLSLAVGLTFPSSFTHTKRAEAISCDSWKKKNSFFERSNQCRKRSAYWLKRMCVCPSTLPTAKWGVQGVFQSQQPVLWFSRQQLKYSTFQFGIKTESYPESVQIAKFKGSVPRGCAPPSFRHYLHILERLPMLPTGLGLPITPSSDLIICWNSS